MDTVGRIGGDEFAVIVPGAGPDDSAAIARRLQTALAARAPTSVGSRLLPDRRRRPRRAAALGRHQAVCGQARPQHAHEDDRQGAQLGDCPRPRGGRPDGRAAGALMEGGPVLRGHRGPPGLAGARPRAAADGRDPARRRQGFDPRPHPAQAEAAQRLRLGGDPPEPRTRLRDGLAHPRPRDRSCRGSATRWSATTGPDTRPGSAARRSRRPAASCTWPTRSTRSRSGRPYREPRSRQDAMEELQRNAGTQFDPVCVEVLGRYLDESQTAEHPAVAS